MADVATPDTQKQSRAHPNQLAALRPFKPGQSGNPGGKPTGARNFLQARFLKEMAEDFDAHGRQAIEQMRTERPADYIRAIASLMPKELEVKTTAMDELTDEALDAALVAVQAILEAQGEKVSA